MPLLLMESDGVTNCSQKLLHVARTVGRRHILCKAVAVDVADEIARDARVYAAVDHCASLFLYSARRYSKSKAFGSKLE